MKKLFATSLAVLLLFSGFSQVRAAEASVPKISTIADLHKYTIKHYKNDLELNYDGTLDLSEVNFEGFDNNLVNEYKETVDSINEDIQKGILKYNSKFQLEVATVEELENLPSDAEFTTRALPDEPKSFPLQRYATKNVKKIKETYDSYLKAGLLNPRINPMLATQIYFATNVREGGPWDYKREIGWDKVRTVKIDGETYYLTGEDIGNIHYGYVGRELFKRKTLLSAAGIVQILTGSARAEWFDSYFDDPTDQAAIKRGIDWFEDDRFE